MMSSEAIEADVSVAPGAVNVAGGESSDSNNHQNAVDAKIMSDLEMLMEKCDLCERMLKPGSDSPAPSVNTDEACQSVIGFLDACAPRMVELVEAAAQGAVSDVVLMKALEVNDKLTKTLADIDTVVLTETPASTPAAAAGAGNSDADVDEFEGFQDNLDDLLLSDDDGGGGGGGGGGADKDHMFGEEDDSKKPAAATKSTGEEDDDEGDNDPFGNTVLQPTSASGAPAPTSTKSEEEFDDFFNDRTTTS